MSENDEKYRLLEAQIDQLRQANFTLLQQVEVLVEFLQQQHPEVSPESLQQARENQTIASKMGRGDYQPM